MVFKEKSTLQKRTEEYKRISEKYPDRIPIIVQKHSSSKAPDIDKNKFLVPGELTVGQFFFVIKKRINLKPEEAIFLFINNKIPVMSSLMSSVYKENKEADGFLYAFYCTESTFG